MPKEGAVALVRLPVINSGDRGAIGITAKVPISAMVYNSGHSVNSQQAKLRIPIHLGLHQMVVCFPLVQGLSSLEEKHCNSLKDNEQNASSPISTSLWPPSAPTLHHVASVWMATKLGWNSQLGLVSTPPSLGISSVGRSCGKQKEWFGLKSHTGRQDY